MSVPAPILKMKNNSRTCPTGADKKNRENCHEAWRRHSCMLLRIDLSPGLISLSGRPTAEGGQAKASVPERSRDRQMLGKASGVLLFAALFVLASTSGCKPTGAEPQAKPPPPAVVQLVKPTRGEISRNVVLPAAILPYQQATLYAKVAGYVKTIRVDKGDEVKAGDLLADLEAPELAADRARLQAELGIAQIDFQRVREASEKAPDLIVPQSIDAARAKWEVAQANLKRIETLLNYAKIVAPFGGIVTRRYVDPGAFIPAATSGSTAQSAAVLTLMDFSKVRVQVAVPENEVPLIKKEIAVRIAIEELPGRFFDGRVTRFSYALDESTKTMLAEIELPNPKAELRPGMYASARVSVEHKTNVLLIPVDALLVEKTKQSVFTVENNTAKKLAVKAGFNDGVHVEIVEGLSADHAIILIGKQTIADGQPVQIAERTLKP